MKNIEREKVYAAAQTIAGLMYNNKCNANGCAECQNNGCCIYEEIAYQVVGSGYAIYDNADVNSQDKTEQIQMLAKTIASARGYGCGEKDVCSKCICLSVECFPLTIAECLIEAGYKKKVEE